MEFSLFISCCAGCVSIISNISVMIKILTLLMSAVVPHCPRKLSVKYRGLVREENIHGLSDWCVQVGYYHETNNYWDHSNDMKEKNYYPQCVDNKNDLEAFNQCVL